MNKLFLGILIFSKALISGDSSVEYVSLAPYPGEPVEQAKAVCKLFLFETTLLRKNSCLSYNDSSFLQFYLRRKKLENPTKTATVPLSGEHRIKNVAQSLKLLDYTLSQYTITAIFKENPQKSELIFADYKEGAKYSEAEETSVNNNDQLIFIMERGGGYQASSYIPHFSDDDDNRGCCLCQ